MSLALAQLLTEASALWIVVRVGTSQLEFTGALGLRSVVEWTTYVPVPLSGIGFHHAGITESLSLFSQAQQTLAGEAVLHHAVLILSSIVVGCVAWFLMKWPEEMS
jgi:uncharacterized membrane protein YbhN (UPF0104 family)